MRVERLRILLGIDDVDSVDPSELESESDRMTFVERFVPLPPDAPQRELRMAFRTVVLTQALLNDPPETWQTFERLSELGLEREQIYTQIVMVVGSHMSDSIETQSPFDVDIYVHGLALLPLPTGSDIAAKIVEIVRADQGIPADDHVEAVIESFASTDGGPSRAAEMADALVDEVMDRLVSGPLCWLTGDRTVYVPDLVRRAVFTHRYNESEAELEVLTAGFDLAPFSRFDVLELDDGTEIEQFSADEHHLAWSGPDGWLDQFEPGTLVAVSVEPQENDDPVLGLYRAKLSLRAVDDEPAVTAAVIDAVRATYDGLVGGAGLPVAGDELGWELLFDRPGMFEQVQPPLSALCRAAGLEQRGGQVAHDEEVWRQDLLRDRMVRVLDMLEDPESKLQAANGLRVLDDPDAHDQDVQTTLDECCDPDVLDAIADVLFDHYLNPSDVDRTDTADAPGRLFELAERAIAAARRPRQVAAANYLMAVLYERAADPETAERHLELALAAQPDHVSVLERLGWYRFDRGDAAGAMRRWRELNPLPAGAATIRPFLAPASGDRKLGRNEPCWCGSGRKFKSCHLGSTELPALPDRVGWLCRKATTWLEHATGDVRETLVELAACLVTGDPDVEIWQLGDLDDDGDLRRRFEDAGADPILFDTVLHEAGHFRLFLHERGSLLPEDEQLLAASWMTVDRSVHEVVTVEPGSGLDLRDLATGDVAQVRERTASHQLAVGDRICARVVPDGASNQIIGGIFGVSTGTEEIVLDLCQAGDAHELCAWAGRLSQGPTIEHRPGMLDDMLDRRAVDDVLAELGEHVDHDAAVAAIGAEMQRQMQMRWLDENVPALGGLTPREAAADPTRREQLERLLGEFEAGDRRRREMEESGGAGGMRDLGGYDVPSLRRELGLD